MTKLFKQGVRRDENGYTRRETVDELFVRIDASGFEAISIAYESGCSYSGGLLVLARKLP